MVKFLKYNCYLKRRHLRYHTYLECVFLKRTESNLQLNDTFKIKIEYNEKMVVLQQFLKWLNMVEGRYITKHNLCGMPSGCV